MEAAGEDKSNCPWGMSTRWPQQWDASLTFLALSWHVFFFPLNHLEVIAEPEAQTGGYVQNGDGHALPWE